jgi:predicted site-specific integrase-resolvase
MIEKLLSRKEAAKALGISVLTLDEARNSGLVSYIQYTENGRVYFTESALEEYMIRSTHKAKPKVEHPGSGFRRKKEQFPF